jgi:succinate dehydrogenase/fumarate reductase cytochrome b subunit
MTAASERRAQVNNRTYERVSTGFAAWLIQRIAALLLLVLVPLKIWSGWAFTGQAPGGTWLAGLHVNPWIDISLIVALAFHALYGVRTVLIEAGMARFAQLLFVLATAGGLLIALAGVIFTL